MSLPLKKGENLPLTKKFPGLKKVIIGLGWNPRVTDGQKFDLDATAFCLKTDGKSIGDTGVCYYFQTKILNDALVHSGDNQTGQGEGDDEKITVDLEKVPAEVTKIAFAVTIDEYEARKQSFGQVGGAYIRVVNAEGGAELAKYDLSEDASTETAMVFGELYRDAADANAWKFKAVGQGYAGGLRALGTQFGINFGS